jgi:hypothetical protein
MLQGFVMKSQSEALMKRPIYIVAAVLLCSLSAFGAADLTIDLGLGTGAATLAGIVAFIGNFFMIEPIQDIVRR